MVADAKVSRLWHGGLPGAARRGNSGYPVTFAFDVCGCRCNLSLLLFRRDAVFGGLHGLEGPTLYVLERRQSTQGGDQVVAAAHHEEVVTTMNTRIAVKARAPPARATWGNRLARGPTGGRVSQLTWAGTARKSPCRAADPSACLGNRRGHQHRSQERENQHGNRNERQQQQQQQQQRRQQLARGQPRPFP